MGKIGRVFKILTLGGLLGFIGGLLFAPQKGEQTREKLKEALDKGKSKFEELKEEFGKREE
ncbi:MAG: YtxH domain-containing protein, partial [Candidatus Margulisbacteria bacterium]|nr:YtxH domain-containing protein [Candidatus Margulisiibacteriota bacterium]